MSLISEAIEQNTLELAQHKHTPTKAMQTVAKLGVRKAQAGAKVTHEALALGKKIASGQSLKDEHVEKIASYNAALDSPPKGTDPDVMGMLHAGSPGCTWAGSRMAALDISGLAEHPAPELLALDQDGKNFSLEVFVRDGMGEPVHLDAASDDGLIWAPILRSGMLAMRPGADGEKKRDPLVFVPGTAADPRKEIGLQNLVDSFNDNAIQHVTVPTSHNNGVLDNTGFIKGLKIVDSKKFPGEKVLVGGHDIREPGVKEKMTLGTIANRSCGIVYDYVNTETGKSYPQALDHVALTNRPWVTGMTAYGDVDEEGFADREIIPMLLSEPTTSPKESATTDEAFDDSEDRFEPSQWQRSCVLDCGVGDVKDRFSMPIREPDGTLNVNAVREAAAKLAGHGTASLSQKKDAARSLIAAHKKLDEAVPDGLKTLVATSTNLSQAERDELLLADVQWGSNEVSMNDITSQVAGYLDEMGSPDEIYPIFSVMDVVGNPDPKALVRVSYGDPSGARDAWVIPLELAGDKVTLSDWDSWVPVQKEWVTDEDAAQDKTEVVSLLGGKTGLSDDKLELGTLTAAQRKALPDSAFVFPATREYPIQDLAHAKNALARAAQNETGARLRTVRNAVYKRYPQLKSSTKNTSLASDLLKGGAVKPTIKEQVDRLGLSEDQAAVLAPILAQNEELQTKLAEERKNARVAAVKARVEDLQAKKFSPGFCRIYEEIALGDDGDVAAVLNLSDDAGKSAGEKDYTATEIVERVIAALPVDDSGALALADRGSLLTSPIGDRPPIDAAEQREVEEKNGKRPKTTDEWLAEAEKHSPGISAQFAETSTSKEG